MCAHKGRRLNKNFILLCIALALLAANITVLLTRRGSLPAADVALPEYVRLDYIPKNDFSRPGTPLKEISAVVVHYVGNPGTSAKANRNYFAGLALSHETYASSHFIVGLEGEVIACVPMTEVAYASNTRNDDTISIEVCHEDETGAFSAATYERLVELTAWLCGTFDLDAETDVIRHYDVSGKICPKYYVENPAAWETFKSDVSAKAR